MISCRAGLRVSTDARTSFLDYPISRARYTYGYKRPKKQRRVGTIRFTDEAFEVLPRVEGFVFFELFKPALRALHFSDRGNAYGSVQYVVGPMGVRSIFYQVLRDAS